jgi:hypothetical protein
MDDNHISVVSHRRENVRFVAERWGLKGIGKGDKGSGRGGGDLALTSFFFFFSYDNCFIFSRISFILHRIVTTNPLCAIPIGI